jgi:hypothetical protein
VTIAVVVAVAVMFSIDCRNCNGNICSSNIKLDLDKEQEPHHLVVECSPEEVTICISKDI